MLSKYQLLIFFLLSYALSWWSAPFASGQILPHGPAVAAIIILGLTSGRVGLRTLWERITHWRVAWYWYLAGPALIVLYQVIAAVINVLLGATITKMPGIPSSSIFLELLLLGGLWEEPGWTGYALPKLQEQFSRLPNGKFVAALVLGAFRAIWHLPLFLSGNIPWFDVVIFEVAVQLIIAWLYNRSGGSVLVVMLFHFVSNLMGAAFISTFSGEERTAYYAIFMGLAALIAIVLYKDDVFRKRQKTQSRAI